MTKKIDRPPGPSWLRHLKPNIDISSIGICLKSPFEPLIRVFKLLCPKDVI